MPIPPDRRLFEAWSACVERCPSPSLQRALKHPLSETSCLTRALSSCRAICLPARPSEPSQRSIQAPTFEGGHGGLCGGYLAAWHVIVAKFAARSPHSRSG